MNPSVTLCCPKCGEANHVYLSLTSPFDAKEVQQLMGENAQLKGENIQLRIERDSFEDALHEVQSLAAWGDPDGYPIANLHD